MWCCMLSAHSKSCWVWYLWPQLSLFLSDRDSASISFVIFQAFTEPSFPDGFVLSFPMRTNYMYGLVRKEITEMYAFTACLWLKAKEGGIGTPFSYSVPGQSNELVLLQGIHNPVELLINDKVNETICCDSTTCMLCIWTCRSPAPDVQISQPD